jgi:Zn-dependent M28 family amino/carboxypeptidase
MARHCLRPCRPACSVNGSPFASGHVPFIDAGLPAVLAIEAADSTNSNVHSMSDTLEHINYELTLEVVRMNVAFLANERGQTWL